MVRKTASHIYLSVLTDFLIQQILKTVKTVKLYFYSILSTRINSGVILIFENCKFKDTKVQRN